MLKKRIFSLFLISAFLLNLFPLSALAYPAYSQPANNLAVAGPYEAAIAGVANWGTNMEDGLTDLAYEYFTAGRKYRIRQAGTISRIRIHTVDKSNITGFYLKIWRQATGAGYGYNLVGTSENLASKLVHNGFATIDLSSPIAGVQEGDFYGYRIETSSRTKNFYAKPENDKTGETYLVGTFYKNGNVGSSFNWEGTANPVKQFALPIELYMAAPQVVLIGDSIIAGRTAHHSYIDHLLSPLNNVSSTIGWKLKNITGYTYQNMGISYSQTISVIADRFDKDVINLKPKIVVIEGGINDVAGSTTQESFIASWKSMLQKAQNDSNIETVIVLKILPWTGGNYDQMRKRDTWNAALEVEAAKYSKAIVVDASPYVGQYRGTGDPGNLWDIKSAYRPGGGDVMHFNADGHEKIAQAIADHLPKPSATFDNDFTTWNKGEITVNYNLIQTGGNTNLNISQTDTSGIEYSTDNIYWYDATQGTGGDPMTGLSASSTPGINHSFIWNTTTDLPTTENSTVYLRIRPSDNTSSATAWVVSNSFGVDNVAPSVSDNVPATWQNNDITVTLTCTDNGSGCDKVYYTLDGSDPTTASSYVNAGSSWQFTYSTEGTKTLKYRGEDSAGNLGGIATAANQLRLDKTAPVINDDVSAAWKTSDITVTFNCTDTASGCDKVYYTTDGTNPTTSSASVDLSDNWQFVFSTEGVYNLKYFSKDIAGNVSAVKTAINQIKLDKTAPVVTAGTNKKESSLFTQVATISDLGSGADTNTYQWAKVSGPGTVNFGTDKALNTTISVNKAGTYVISFTASDKAGHSASANFVLTWFIPNSGNAAFFVKPITPPDGFKVKINDGATSTTNRKTTLKFNAGSDVKKIAISMTGDFTDASQEEYSPTKQWDLCSKLGGAIKEGVCPNGPYTVYVRFYTAYGHSSAEAVAQSSIILESAKIIEEEKKEEKKEEVKAVPSCQVPLYPKTPIKYGAKNNNPADVKLLQEFLNTYEEFNLKVDGFYSLETRDAVIKWQEKYTDEVLKPWGISKGTGYVYTTTLKKIKDIHEAKCQKETTVPKVKIPTSTPTDKYIFTRDLYTGVIGPDVKHLQIFLNKNGFTLANTGPGSPDNETEKFGALTRQALSRFQAANNISPTAGYFGSITREKINNY